jgi:nucleotide-binding universal stress UspA family protein
MPLNLQKILIPVDFSNPSPGAAHYAKALAQKFNAKLILAHVLQPIYISGGGAEPAEAMAGQLYSQLADSLRARLAAFQAEHFAGYATEAVLLQGGPAEEIVRFAHDQKVSLIVLPTHGYGPFRRFILGSTTAKVLNDADCPVFTGVHLSDATLPKEVAFANIICAVDFGAQSVKVIQTGAALANAYGGRLHLVHALPPLEHGEARFIDTAYQEAVEADSRRRATSLIDATKVNASLVMEHGAPSKVVHQAAESVKADLVVIGRHSGTGLLGRLRPHAYSIVRESPAPVVSV